MKTTKTSHKEFILFHFEFLVNVAPQAENSAAFMKKIL